MAKEGAYALLKLPSANYAMCCLNAAPRWDSGACRPGKYCLGQGRQNALVGFRPTTRGIAKNPVDHPLAAARGRSKGNHPMTPWATDQRLQTRKNHSSDKYNRAKKKR